MSEAPGQQRDPEPEAPAQHREGRGFPGVSLTIIVALVVAVLLVWDFSEIIFTRQLRQAALENVEPGMRLTHVERDLNSQRYFTLYISDPGQPPMLDVSTCRRIPFTMRAIKSLFPRWKTGELATSWMLFRTHFKIIADDTGAVRSDSQGKPLVVLE